MSYQEKNTTVSLAIFILILGYYLTRLYQMVQEGGLVSNQLFSLWAVIIVVGILATIFASILTNIVLTIVHAIRTGGEVEERFIEDERDKLIELMGVRSAYITFSIGVLLAMLTFAFGQPPLVMFSMIIAFSLLAEIVGDISKIFLYRRGF